MNPILRNNIRVLASSLFRYAQELIDEDRDKIISVVFKMKAISNGNFRTKPVEDNNNEHEKLGCLSDGNENTIEEKVDEQTTI